MPEMRRFDPDDPREWLNRARSDLALAQNRIEGVYFEDLCFHAQQAAEKAIKAVLIGRDVEFPYIHDVGRLLELVSKAGVSIPNAVEEAATLTRFAVLNRYPGLGPSPTEDHHSSAIRSAKSVLRWAEQLLE